MFKKRFAIYLFFGVVIAVYNTSVGFHLYDSWKLFGLWLLGVIQGYMERAFEVQPSNKSDAAK